MKRMAVVWMIAGLLAGTAICMAGESKEKPRRTDRESVTKETENMGASQAYLGIAIEALHPALASQLPDLIPSGEGVLIAQVAKGSPAEKAGLKTHDIVLAYGEQKVRSPEQLARLVQQDKAGQEVLLHIVRAGRSEEVKVTLGEVKAGEASGRHRVLRPFQGQQHDRSMVPKEEESRWNTFDSMALKRLDENRFRAEIRYRDQEGKVDSRSYEGTREELRKAIEAEKDMPETERSHLLRALDVPGSGFGFGPAFHMTPQGDWIWDFEGFEP